MNGHYNWRIVQNWFLHFYFSNGNQTEKIKLKCVEHTPVKMVKILNTHLVGASYGGDNKHIMLSTNLSTSIVYLTPIVVY
jgi:hypothetical protein